MTMEMSGTTALVTGSTAGIGRAVAQQLADQGAEVVVHGRNSQRGAETVDEITARGGQARFAAADLSDPDDVRHLAAEAGDVDVLINNAGIYQFASTPDVTPEMFDAHMAINTRAPVLLVGALAPGMASRHHGTIVSISTEAATTPARGAGVYGASKAALELLTRAWADEFGAQGVRVNAVSSGPVRTPGTEVMGEDSLQSFARQTILGRPAEPDEIAEAITFLASPRASYITGAILDVQGGQLALSP
jgi:NAD(P)-dependent dehydrogenase (short-subunit alcohol dehydrogenase family)